MLLGRYLLRSTIEKKALKYRVFRAIDNALKNEGFKFTVLLRLCPLIPFTFLNYVFGLTSVTIKNYILGRVASLRRHWHDSRDCCLCVPGHYDLEHC